LLGNVFDSSTTTASAEITVQVDGKPRTVNWERGLADGDLRRVEVYDARCGAVYVNEQSEVTYEPGGVRLLSDLVRVCDELARRLKVERDALSKPLASMPLELRDSDSGRWYAGITALTADADVVAHCSFTALDAERLAALQAMPSPTAQRERAAQLRAIKARCDQLIATLAKCPDALSQSAGRELVARRAARDSANEARNLAARLALNDMLPGTASSDAWRLLWAAARRYSEEVAYPGITFPALGSDSACLLCQRPLDDTSRTTFRRIDDFVSDRLSQDATAAAERWQAGVDALPTIPGDEDATSTCASAGIAEGAPRTALLALLTSARSRLGRILAATSEADLQALSVLDVTALDELRSRATALGASADEAELLSKSDAPRASESEVRNLKARRWLSDRQEEVLDYAERRRTVALYEKAIGKCGTGPITTKKAALVDQTVTEPLLTRFKDELLALGAGTLPIEISKVPAEKGKALYQIRLRGCAVPADPARVLSEGEFRVISLAAFLAYAVHSGSRDAVVFDDPFTSLDQGFQEEVAARLAALAVERQVIVFTHSVAFAVLLQDAAPGTPVVQIEKRSHGCGEPRTAPALHVSEAGRALQLLAEQVAAAQRAGIEGEEWEREGSEIARNFRITLERVVEDILLRGIVKRWTRRVGWEKRLVALGALAGSDCDLLDALLTKYSAFAHSQPGDAPPKPPESKTLKADIDSVVTWAAAYRKRERTSASPG